MRIVIDGQAMQTASRFRGIGRYAHSLIRAMIEQGAEHEFILALSDLFPETIEPIRAEFEGLLPGGSIRVWGAPGPIRSLDPANAWRRRTAELIRETFLISLRPDWLLVPSLFEGFIDDAATSLAKSQDSPPVAVICYDIIPYLMPDDYLPEPNVRAWYEEKLEQLSQADLWLAISDTTRDDVIEHLGFPAESVVNIYAATSADWKAARSVPSGRIKELRRRYGLKRPFVMYTGGDDPRKNIAGLIRAYAMLPESLRADLQLTIVCQIDPARRERVEQLAMESGLAPDEMIVTGYVPDADLRDLYSLCKIFVLPSLYEGFGLPILEAMGSGKAVIGSNSSSIREVIGRDDALFDPASDVSIRDKMEEVLRDDDLRQDLERYGIVRSRQFSWETSARKTLAAMEHARPRHATGPARPATISGEPKPRLAFVSPLPPERSGISDYSADLIPALSAHYAVEVIVDQAEISDPWILKNCPVRSVGWFRNHADQFDRVLYQIGNSEFHQHMFDLLEEIPGIVVLHDFFLSNILRHLELSGIRRGIWWDYIYRSHGYAAAAQCSASDDTTDIAAHYPCSLPILENALHVVLHSEHALDLGRRWYGPGAAERCSVVPLVRQSTADSDKSAARRALGLPDDAMIVCAPGHLAPSKLNHRLLKAWMESGLGAEARLAAASSSFLVFAGAPNDPDYSSLLEADAAAAGLEHRVKVTGWLEQEAYRHWLAAADIGVQLRTGSRGETSAAALDCLNSGLPTITNAHGALAEVPEHCVMRLPDAFSDADLTSVLNQIARDGARREALGAAARAYIRAHHAPEVCASAIADVIEQAYRGNAARIAALPTRLASVEPVPENREEFAPLASAVARCFPPRPRLKQLLLDISELVTVDSKSGIQRVVRSLLIELVANPPQGYRVEPVYASPEAEYRYARQFMTEFLDCREAGFRDEPIEIADGDIFLMLDLHHRALAHRATFEAMRRYGVSIWAIVYDLLPVQLPHCFLPETESLHRSWLDMVSGFDGAVCISRSVADELDDWISAEKPDGERRPALCHFHLGADIEASHPTSGLPSDADETLAQLARHPTFVMVGTIEPRKGYAQTLDAFERLWSRGLDVNLVIVGKQGWMVDALAARIQKHRQKGARLFWLDGISDEYLDLVYAAATCLIAASEGEGFGLPLIEAARHGVPIIARDIAVFREVAGNHATYFDAIDGDELAEAISTWMTRHEQGKTPPSDAMSFLTWAESAAQLQARILGTVAATRRNPAGEQAEPPRKQLA